MTTENEREPRRIPALRFKQWLDEWDQYTFSEVELRRRPPKHLYMFSMRAAELRTLCDVYRRERTDESVEGIQRLRDESRTERIQNYVRFGYPYGDLKLPLRTEESRNLRKPGWLPTAIVINILIAGDKRRAKTINADDLVTVLDGNDGRSDLVIPSTLDPNRETFLAPFEVIDGQHRLWAFDDQSGEGPLPDDFELPVVAYHGLDISWQAYLFWSINVSPKRINPSHAFDLYPLLRTQDWLDRVGELTVYREARAQELTELMFTHELSPWKNRINMLGERGSKGVSQAAWVRTLLNSFLSSGRGAGRAGLFQANLNDGVAPLDWSRTQQAAFLIMLWRDLVSALEENQLEWWIRRFGGPEAALTDRRSLLNQDQGLRAVNAVANDVFYHSAQIWQLDRWIFKSDDEIELYHQDVARALRSLEAQPFRQYVRDFCLAVSRFDWRSYDGPNVSEEAEDVGIKKRAYRGTGGYTVLRMDVLRQLVEAQGSIGRTAQILLHEAQS